MSKKSESASRGDSLDAEMTSLKVAVRVRPLNDKEINLGSKIVVDVHGNDIVITDLKVPEHQGYDHRSRVHKFSFDYGFSSVDTESVQYASQATVFENFGRVVLQALLEGYNCCVIAYGQSGSGKTYTMMGMKGEEGLTPRICEGLLMKLEDKAKQNISFAVNISYMEIYNEQVYDLLQKPDEKSNLNKPRLRVREHPIHGPFVEGLSTHVLRSRDNVCQLISEGNDNRIKAATYIHERSSRSHAIFTVHCSQACLDESQPKEVVSKLQLVDLAGSEKAGHEFCQSRLKEGASINKSLVALGNVISALVELSQRFQNVSYKGGKQLFVPYRDSQLTWLMKDSLGGNSHTFMLAAVSPSNECCLETLSTLRYAQRAKNVLNTPIVNEDPATKIIRNLRLEVNKLKSLLINADVLSKKAIIEPLSNISHLNSVMKKSEKKVDHLTRCWLEKWLETYNSILKKTSSVKEESSFITKGTNVPQVESVAPNSMADKTDSTAHDCIINVDNSEIQCGSSVNVHAADSDAILSDKSSSVSSECVILPNETIFYSKGKKNHRHQDYFKDNAPYFKSASLNHMSDIKCEILDKCIKDSSSSVFHFNNSSLHDISYCKGAVKSPLVMNSKSISAPNVQNSDSLHNSLFTSFSSLPKDIQTLPDSTKPTKETEKKGTDFITESSSETICFEKACKETKTCSSSQVINPTGNHAENDSNYEKDADVRNVVNDNEFSQHETQSANNCISTPDDVLPGTQNDDEILHTVESEEKDCTNSFSLTKCMMHSPDKMHGCREVEFNDTVTEESDNFVKLLNQLHDGSAETINHCFKRKDSEILSLLSLSSNDYPPFHSLDDIFNDGEDMEVPDETGNIEFDVLCENKDKYMRESWDDFHSSSDVTDLSESSDAESEFDYVDFTKNAMGTCSKTEIFCDSSFNTSDEQQNHQGVLRQINRCKENLLSIPENEVAHQMSLNSDASEIHEAELCYFAGNQCVDVNSGGRTMTTRNEMKLESENSVHGNETLHELSPLTCKNDNVSVLCSDSLTTDNRPPSKQNVSSMKTTDNRNVENVVADAQISPVLQKRLCNSDSILKTLPGSEIKHCPRSDNNVYVTPEKCSILPALSDGSYRKESRTSYENVNNDNISKTCFRNKDSISDLLGFSVQDLLDMINGKSAVLKKQIYPVSEERLQYDNAIPEEIQKFIDNTEITDANKLADELLKKKLPLCSTSMTSTSVSNDSVLADYNNKNKLSSESKLCSSHSDTDCASYMIHDEKSGCKNLDVLVLSGRAHSQAEQMNGEKRASDTEKSVTPDAHITDHTYNIVNMKCTDEIKAEVFNGSEENGRFKYKQLHMAVEEVHCEKENALEYFIVNGSKEMFIGSLSDESDSVDNVPDVSINKTEKSSQSQQISAMNNKLGAKEITSPHSDEIYNAVSFRSNFLTESPDDDDITDGNSQAKIFTEYSTFGNLNIIGLTPIQEEAVDEEEDVISEASEDDSPNISFQFDSLERPKNVSLVKKDSTCIEQCHETDNIIDGKGNIEELHKSENLSNMLNDVSKMFYNKNYDLPVETYAENEEQDPKYIEMLTGTANSGDMLKFSSSSNFKENLTNSSVNSCKLAAELRDYQKCPSSFNRGNYEKCDTISEDINTNVESPKNNFKISNSKEVNNLSDQLCSWDSLSSSTSSDSITFVFVGKENKNIMSEATNRSFQSSLFSSVSLDSLERSSVHQNQVACASPRTLSIDSLVAEELLFQLRNSDPIQPLTSELKQDAGNKCEMNCTILTDLKSAAPPKTNFAATSQLSSNQHLKLCHHMHYSVENDVFSQEVAAEIPKTEISEKQNGFHDTITNQIVTYHENTFPSRSHCGNIGDNNYQNLRENYSCISPESNGSLAEKECSYLKMDNSEEHHISENVCCNISSNCDKENLANIHMHEIQKHIPEESNFNTCSDSSITAPFDCIGFENHCDLNLQNNKSNTVLDYYNVTSLDQSLEPVIVDNCDKLVHLPEPANMCSKNNSFCNKCVTNDHNELIPVKELTEENLKIFNSEFEENQEENFILPPPSTFGGSDDNGLSVISNYSSFSLENNHSKISVDVISKSTQTDHDVQNEYNEPSENNAVVNSRNTDLIERMMDLMAETLKLMKEQYSRTPKRSHSHTRKKLNFSSDSDKNMSDLKQKSVVSPTANKHGKYFSKEKSADNKVIKYIQSILPPDNDSDHAQDKFSLPVTHSKLLSYPQRTAIEKHVSMRSKVDHGDQRPGCAMSKKPNFYTLPFDFITCKYQCKKSLNTPKLNKPDAFSQASVNYQLDKTKNLNLASDEFNNLSAFKSLSVNEHEVSGINGMDGLKQSLSNTVSSKSHLKHLIELRRQVVEATTGSSNVRESQVSDPLKSSSSSSEGYLSSVSSRGPFRHLSEVSTDSQEFSCTTTGHLFQKQCFPKHSVKPLDFSTLCNEDIAVSPDTRWMNTSADSGAFFLDSPGTEKKANLHEYPTATTSVGATSSAVCTSPKRLKTRSPLHCSDTLTASINPQERKVPSFSKNKWDEIRSGRRQHGKSDFAHGFQELDEIGENYLDISLRKSVSVHSSTSSDISFCTGKSLKNRSPKSSRTSRSSPRLKHVSSQEIQRLLESIENDRKLLQQMHRNCVFDRKHLASPLLPSCSSLEITDDLFYQDTYKSLPTHYSCRNSSASQEV